MTLLTLCLLAVVQGITEFLPISSSAHLILIHEWTGQTADALALDVAVHIGSVVAVLIYLRSEVALVLRGVLDLMRGRTGTDGARLALCVIVATIPALIVGFILALTGWIDHLRNPTVIGVTMIVFGLWLYWAHRAFPEDRGLTDWTLRDAVKMGLWQALALIPGVSRSGVSMTVARISRFERHAAARLSMLLSIPITLSTGGYLGLKAVKQGISADLLADVALAAALSFVAAWFALKLMMAFLSRVSFTPYVIYRVLLGIVLLVMI